jgi:hypothetical protein
MRKAGFVLVLSMAAAVGILLQGRGAAEPVNLMTVRGEQEQAPSLSLDKESYLVGETISVTFTAPADYSYDAWVGLIPSNVPHGEESVNDQYDIAYFYLDNKTEGEFEFQAPKRPGSYDIRMNDTDNNGKEVAGVTFEVLDREPSLALEKSEFEPGEKITVRFTASAEYAANAWVGIVPSEVPHGEEAVNDEHDLAYLSIGEDVKGVLEFAAPESPGDYDLRMHDTDDDGREVASVSFKVLEK